MLLLHQMRDALLADVTNPACQRLWDEARARHPPLAEHRDVAALLATLWNVPGADTDHVDVVARALVTEYQVQRDPFWAGLLIVAYFPMLRALSAQIYSPDLSRGERDQMVVADFLETLWRFPLRGRATHTVSDVRQRTRQRVFRRIRRESWPPLSTYPPEELTLLGDASRGIGDLAATEEASLALARIVADPQVVGLLREHLCQDPARRVVQEQYPDADPAEHERLYQREKRRRHRAIRQLRAEVRQILGSPIVRTRSTKGTP